MQKREERQRMITDCLSSHIEQMFFARSRDTMEYFYKNKESVLHRLLSALALASEPAKSLISSGKKRKIRMLQFSFLLSGALMNERKLRMDFYDERYFGDITEAGGYWDYSVLFPYIDEDIESLKGILSKQMLRVKEYELIDLRMVYHVGVFAIMEEVLTKLAAEDGFTKAFTEIYEPKVSVMYGAYLDQSKLIATVLGR